MWLFSEALESLDWDSLEQFRLLGGKSIDHDDSSACLPALPELGALGLHASCTGDHLENNCRLNVYVWNAHNEIVSPFDCIRGWGP